MRSCILKAGSGTVTALGDASASPARPRQRAGSRRGRVLRERRERRERTPWRGRHRRERPPDHGQAPPTGCTGGSAVPPDLPCMAAADAPRPRPLLRPAPCGHVALLHPRDQSSLGAVCDRAVRPPALPGKGPRVLVRPHWHRLQAVFFARYALAHALALLRSIVLVRQACLAAPHHHDLPKDGECT